MKAIGIFATFVVTSFVAWIWSGWVLTKLWHWFVVPFFEAHELRIPVAIGLAIIVGYLTKEVSPSSKPKVEKSTSEHLIEFATIAILKPLVAFVVGWIVHLFV